MAYNDPKSPTGDPATMAPIRTVNTNGKSETDEATYDHAEDSNSRLNRARTAGALSLSPELFEQLYLQPKNAVAGQLRQTFGNPTPIGLIGFLMSLTPLSCSLMGWRGASNTGAAGIPDYFFFGGMLMSLGGFLEWIIGNSFPAVVFLTFGAFWLTLGGTLTPAFAAFSSFAAEGEAAATGLQTQGFNASYGFFLLSMALVDVVFLICSVRTNICFMVIFFSLVLVFSLLTAAYWYLAEDYTGNAALAGRLIVAGGACAFVTIASGWYIFLAQLLASVDFPVALPVGDLSAFVKGKSERSRRPGSQGEV